MDKNYGLFHFFDAIIIKCPFAVLDVKMISMTFTALDKNDDHPKNCCYKLLPALTDVTSCRHLWQLLAAQPQLHFTIIIASARVKSLKFQSFLVSQPASQLLTDMRGLWLDLGPMKIINHLSQLLMRGTKRSQSFGPGGHSRERVAAGRQVRILIEIHWTLICRIQVQPKVKR